MRAFLIGVIRASVTAALLCAATACLDSDDNEDDVPIRIDARPDDGFDAAAILDAAVPDAPVPDAASPAIIVTPTGD